MRTNIKKNQLLEHRKTLRKNTNKILQSFSQENSIPQLVMVTTFPPRECGIATYSQDLTKALTTKFKESYAIKICALENGVHNYNEQVNYILETNNAESYKKFTNQINNADNVNLVVFQHEFGLFKENEKELLNMLSTIQKKIIVVFHTVLPQPNEKKQQYIQNISKNVDALIVMTKNAKEILENDYLILSEKITVIPHGTHLVEQSDKAVLKVKYACENRKVLSTFGLISSGKSIETTLYALPAILANHSDVLFLIIGKTHPSVVKNEGEKYRNSLEQLIENLNLKENVLFINEYLPLDRLLEYLQLTDIYLFTSKDRNQAVSGTFSYALSCGCPIISTPIPHACEVLKHGTGSIIDFENPVQLAREVNVLLHDDVLRNNIKLNGLHLMAPTAWENAALSHAQLFESITETNRKLHYTIPPINLNHFQKMTTDFGMIQFSIINQPDINSGYTLDDNARALIAMCHHFKINKNKSDLNSIECYLNFIEFCLQSNGTFLNYVSGEHQFTKQNKECNLEDSFGRAIWALGYFLSLYEMMPQRLIVKAEKLFTTAIVQMDGLYSTRAMAFCIKGIYFANQKNSSKVNTAILEKFADRLVQMYKHEADKNWFWFESYLTYANSVLPESMLFAWLSTQKQIYKTIALESFDFLLSKIVRKNYLQVISNKGWMHNGQNINDQSVGGEQPIDVAYTVITLSEFYNAFKITAYNEKMHLAFSWFLGNNHLNQIVYNPCTGGCYDGLENNYVNLNQGAESTISYLMARLTIDEYISSSNRKLKANPLKLEKII